MGAEGHSLCNLRTIAYNCQLCGPFGPFSKGNFRCKMTTIVGNRGQLWTSALRPHLLSPHLDFPHKLRRFSAYPPFPHFSWPIFRPFRTPPPPREMVASHFSAIFWFWAVSHSVAGQQKRNTIHPRFTLSKMAQRQDKGCNRHAVDRVRVAKQKQRPHRPNMSKKCRGKLFSLTVGAFFAYSKASLLTAR